MNREQAKAAEVPADRLHIYLEERAVLGARATSGRIEVYEVYEYTPHQRKPEVEILAVEDTLQGTRLPSFPNLRPGGRFNVFDTKMPIDHPALSSYGEGGIELPPLGVLSYY